MRETIIRNRKNLKCICSVLNEERYLHKIKHTEVRKEDKSDFYRVLVIQNLVSLYHHEYFIFPRIDWALLNKIFL